MKINFPILDQSIDIKQPTFLIILEKTIFAKLINELYDYNEDSQVKLYNHHFEALKQKEIMLISDILSYNLNSTTVLKMIHNDLIEQFNSKPEVKLLLDNYIAKLTDLIVFECVENELNLQFDEITIQELIKAMGIRLEDTSKSIFEKCLEIIQIFKYLPQKKLLVFINISAYLTKNELFSIQELIVLNNIYCLFVEPREVYDFPQIIIDEDFLVTSKNMI